VGLLVAQGAEMVRVNTRVSKQMNEWLDKLSVETGMAKSTIIFLALENYKREQQAMGAMADMSSIIEKLDEVQRAVQRRE
jgi:predicted DNA-binding protein